MATSSQVNAHCTTAKHYHECNMLCCCDVEFCILDECLALPTHICWCLVFPGLLLEDFVANSEIAELEEELAQLTLTKQPVVGELDVCGSISTMLCAARMLFVKFNTTFGRLVKKEGSIVCSVSCVNGRDST